MAMILTGAMLGVTAADPGDDAGALQGGYPGPIARPGIPTGPDIGAIKVGQSSRTTYVCGFTPEHVVNFAVDGHRRGAGQADANGCVTFVVTALTANSVLIRTFGPDGPITLGPIRVHHRAGVVTVSSRKDGVKIGLSMGFTIVVKHHPVPPPPPTTRPVTRTTIPRTTTTTKPRHTKRRTTPPTTRPVTGSGPPRRPGLSGGQVIAGVYIPPFDPGHLTPKQTKSAVVAIAAAAAAVAAAGGLGGAAAGAASAGGSAGAVGSAGGSPGGGEGAGAAEAVEIEADRIDDELPEWEDGGLGGDLPGGSPPEGA